MIGAALKTAFSAIGSAGAALQAGLSVGTTGLGYLQAKATADAQNAANAQANERARQYMIEDMDQTTRMGQQEIAAATQKLNQNQIDSRKTSASAQVAASSGGVSGLSVQALLGDIFGNEAAIRDSVNQNLENTGQQIAMERRSISRGYETTINTRPQPQQPSLLGTALEAGTGIVGAYKDQWKVRGKTG
jgi:hypothetical protein